MTGEPRPLPDTARLLIRVYLIIATIGAVVAAPMLAFIGWMGWEWTKPNWPGNWLGWVFYLLFSLIVVGGPIVGWQLYRRQRPYLALGVSVFSFLLAPLIVAGVLAG